jgi:hypothetical protein
MGVNLKKESKKETASRDFSNLLRNVSREERKIEANKPLYLTRYE